MSPRIYLRRPAPSDESEFLAAARGSRSLHRPWITAPSTPAQFQSYVERISQPASCGFLICLRDDGRIAGAISITNIVLGLFQSGHLSSTRWPGTSARGSCARGCGR